MTEARTSSTFLEAAYTATAPDIRLGGVSLEAAYTATSPNSRLGSVFLEVALPRVIKRGWGILR